MFNKKTLKMPIEKKKYENFVKKIVFKAIFLVKINTQNNEEQKPCNCRLALHFLKKLKQ